MEKIELTVSQLAQITRRSRETVTTRLEAARVEPSAKGGRYPLYELTAALEAIFQPEIESAQVGPLDEARRRRAVAQAELAELAARERRGQLVDAGALDRTVIALWTSGSARLQGVPAEVAVDVASETSPAVCQEIVRKAIWRALEDLARAGREAQARVKKAKQRQNTARARERAKRRGE